VRYAIVSPGKDWLPEIRLPLPISPKSPGDTQKYQRPGQERLASMPAGGRALVDSTARPGESKLPILEKIFTSP
jgi:hypothetical protein